jgi:hypothetical protein
MTTVREKPRIAKRRPPVDLGIIVMVSLGSGSIRNPSGDDYVNSIEI